MKLYYPQAPLLLVQNLICGSSVRFAFVLTRKSTFKVSYDLCISRIIRKTIVDNIIS